MSHWARIDNRRLLRVNPPSPVNAPPGISLVVDLDTFFMEDQNEEGNGPNFAPQNPNAILNSPMGGVPQSPSPNPAHGLRGDNMESRSIHGGIGAPQFRTLRDYMNPPRQAPSSCIIFPPHYATLNIRPGMMQMLPQFHGACHHDRKLEALEFTKVNAVGSEELKEVSCAVCKTKEHDTISCPVIPGIKEALHGQVNAIGHYGQGARNPYSNTYNPGWRNHPKFGWRNEGTSNPQHIKEGFTTLNLIKHLLHHHNHRIISLHQSLEDTLQQFIQFQGGINSRVDKTLDDIKSQLTLLTQAFTLTEKAMSKFKPSLFLRSGKTIDKTILPIDPKGKGEASKVAEGTVGGDRETGEKKESEVVSREEEKKKRLGKQPGDLEDIREVNLIESIVQEHFERQCIEDPLARMLMFDEGLDYLEVEKVKNFVK
ncbi:hypothetical protein Acr_08g0013340 [Actinidia rufa]|uniref:Uncharacterized protein n=1 Tax=Actinidia rufa TaxID=165716 RepID=A0A7J0F2L0_9ERIC|nr:hypothetical protein Acr_08g0013340 [Actinidia rufa]